MIAPNDILFVRKEYATGCAEEVIKILQRSLENAIVTAPAPTYSFTLESSKQYICPWTVPEVIAMTLKAFTDSGWNAEVEAFRENVDKPQQQGRKYEEFTFRLKLTCSSGQPYR